MRSICTRINTHSAWKRTGSYFLNQSKDNMEILISIAVPIIVFNTIVLIVRVGVVTKNQGFILKKIEELLNQNKHE